MIGYLNNDPNKTLKFSSGKEKDDKTEMIIDTYDQKMMNYIVGMYNNLSSEKINIAELENSVEALSKLRDQQEYNYLSNLLKPEFAKGSKIPSPIPVPSAAFQLHNSVTLSTNDKGNLAIVFNPFFLYDSNTGSTNNLLNINYENTYIGEKAAYASAGFLSSFWVNNDTGLTGNSQGQGNWTAVNIGQGIPNVYDQYRLVSASIVVKYIGRLDIVSGVIGGAIVFDENQYIGLGNGRFYKGSGEIADTAFSTINPSLSKYSNFDLAMDSFYHQENLCLEGCRELYFPIDNTFEEYMKLSNNNILTIAPYLNTENTYNNILLTSDQDYYKSGFNYMIYVLGAPASTSCFKIDIYCNFECLPNAEFLNYMPITPSFPVISPKEKSEAIALVQKKPIMKNNDEVIVPYVKKTSIFEKLKKGFGRFLPSIVKWGKIGLSTLVPGLKPALALAGTMLNAQKNQSLNMSLEEDVE